MIVDVVLSTKRLSPLGIYLFCEFSVLGSTVNILGFHHHHIYIYAIQLSHLLEHACTANISLTRNKLGILGVIFSSGF